MSVETTEDDKRYAKQLFILTVAWLVLVIGAGVLMVYLN
jgi:hypothetical protein